MTRSARVLVMVVGAAGCARRGRGPAESGPAGDSGDDSGGATTAIRCPEGMVPVPPEEPVYCFDAYEVTVEGDGGDADQYAEGAIVATATATARAGVIPTAGLTFSQADVICANTPVVDPRDGAEHGRKRLATASEWEDAGDGVQGEGGTAYPWGDTYEEGRCALPEADGTVIYDAAQPTGSFPGCVSAAGVYDQLGNLWEWADSEVEMDPEGWAALAPGMAVGDGVVRLDEPSLADVLSIDVAGLPEYTLTVDADGRLGALMSSSWWAAFLWDVGYLVRKDAGSAPSNQLPIRFLPQADDGTWVTMALEVVLEATGAHFPDKRDAAYYVGAMTDLHAPAYVHFYDFGGTIGFRCVCDPLPP